MTPQKQSECERAFEKWYRFYKNNLVPLPADYIWQAAWKARGIHDVNICKRHYPGPPWDRSDSPREIAEAIRKVDDEPEA